MRGVCQKEEDVMALTMGAPWKYYHYDFCSPPELKHDPFRNYQAFEYDGINTHKLLIFLIKKASWYQPFVQNLNINMYCDWRRWKHPRAILLVVFMTLVRSWGLIALLNSSDQTTHYFLFSFFIQYLLKAPSEVSILVANTGNRNGHMVWDP